MAEISKIKLPSGNVYDIKDSTAREMIAGGISFIIAWDGTAAPVVANVPAGVVIKYNGTDYTGTLSTADAQLGAFYLVKSSTQVGAVDIYDEYIVATIDANTKAWEKLGDTQVDLSDVVTGVTLNKDTDVVLGESTTFALASGTVTHGTPTTDSVLGASSTFTVTQPTISVTPSTTYLGASASGTAVGADGTASAVTGYSSPTTDTFVKSVSAETNKKLVTTSVPNVTSAGSASTWSFAMGTGTGNTETLVISGANSTAPTLGTAITAATGATDANGTGDSIVTGVTIGSSASAITGLGTPSTETVLKGVKVTSQPSISLSSNESTATGRVQVATGISSASASGTAVSASGDNVTAITGMPSSSVGTTITVGTNDKVTALTNSTSITVSKGS